MMLLARSLDERCLTMQRQGRIGFYVPVMGQEAAQVACAWALDPNDWNLSGLPRTWAGVAYGV